MRLSHRDYGMRIDLIVRIDEQHVGRNRADMGDPKIASPTDPTPYPAADVFSAVDQREATVLLAERLVGPIV